MQTALEQLISKLARRDGHTPEAMIQADVRQLLLTADLNLSQNDVPDVALEAQAGGGRRIDVEVGATVIEVKKDLRAGNVRAEAAAQLKGYVESREKKYGCRYVGVVTDGAEWRCYNLRHDHLEEVSSHTLASGKPDVNAFLVWLEGVLATARDLPPTPDQIRMRLGFGSSSHALDRASLGALYEQHKEAPEVRTKRQLWAKLLETALGTQFEESDDLFVEHTLLVNSAEIIAHVVLGLDVVNTSPASLLSGTKFEESSIFGVVEADFFDWVVFVPKGDVFVRTLARRLARFDWSAVEHDVLKVLYESVIPAETRKKLGEYYTPDWLAEKVVEEVITEPLGQRVLDPACGSGTFLFHAVRRYVAAAEAKKLSSREVLNGVTNHVFGMDLHPVAVTLARITYLLAIGKKRLQGKRDPIQVPVYLGDSMQWERENPTLFSQQEFTIVADDRREVVPPEFKFPNTLLKAPQLFDSLVQQLADLAAGPRRAPGAKKRSPVAVLRRLAIPEGAYGTIISTFETLCRLHDEGRNHIWGYYIRNRARPGWLGLGENRVDVLIGNPPWLSFRFMPSQAIGSRPSMQSRFREMSESRHLWSGAKVATQQDLSGLFVSRMVQLYLKLGGRFGFIMPSAVLDREQFKGFRGAIFDEPEGEVRVEFTTPWNLRRLRPHFFPVAAAVVFGQRSSLATPMPRAASKWSGRLPRINAPWREVELLIQRDTEQENEPVSSAASSYSKRFTNGASIYPRLLFMVEKQQAGPLGQRRGVANVHSLRTAYEKKPWKDIASLQGVVETEFVRPVYLGESILPYRLRKPAMAVIPRDASGFLDFQGDRIEHFPGLADWCHRADELWMKYRSSDRLRLSERLNYHGELENQFPIQPQRVVYSKSGMHLAAARLDNRRAVIDHTLYGGTAASVEEAQYLCAILNAAVVTQLVRPLMSYGKDERHIDKHIWKLPIPMFDEGNPDHIALSNLGTQAEEAIGELDLDEERHFATARREIRAFLADSAIGQEIESRVEVLLSSG